MRMWRECGVNLALILHSHQIWTLLELSCNSRQILNPFPLNSQWMLNILSLISLWILNANFHGKLAVSPVIIRRDCGETVVWTWLSYWILTTFEFSANSHGILTKLTKFSLNSQWIFNSFSLNHHLIHNAFALNYHGMLRVSPVISKWKCGETVVWIWLLYQILTKFGWPSNYRVILTTFTINVH